MKKYVRWMLPVLLAAACLTGCEKKQPVTVTVRNITGYSIVSLELAQTADTGNHTDRMDSEWLDDGAEREVSLGIFTEDELAEGFRAVIRLSDDSEDDFSRLILSDGGTLTFYLDDLGIAVAYDTSDDEIEEMIRELHESMQTVPPETN